MSRSLKAIVRITDRCNLDCLYCYVDRDTRRSSRLKLAIPSLESFYAQVMGGAYDDVTIVWHGGEPTLVGPEYLEQAIELQGKHLKSGVKVVNSIQTNVSVITPRLVDMLKKYEVGVGVSIDAPADVHSSMRVGWNGKSSLPQVLDNIALLREKGLSFGAICVLHKHNYERADEIYDFFRELGLSYHFNPFYRDEATSTAVAADLCITPEQYAEAMIRTYDRYVSDPEHVIDVTDIKEIVASMFTGQSNNCLFAGHCEEFVGILPTGEMYLCDMFYQKDKHIGHIDRFTPELMRSSRPVQVILTRPSALQTSVCGGCEWWAICKGGCPSKASAIYGNSMREEPFCKTRKQLFSHIKSSLSQLGEERR